MTRRAPGRLAAMEPEELRFRLICERASWRGASLRRRPQHGAARLLPVLTTRRDPSDGPSAVAALGGRLSRGTSPLARHFRRAARCPLPRATARDVGGDPGDFPAARDTPRPRRPDARRALRPARLSGPSPRHRRTGTPTRCTAAGAARLLGRRCRISIRRPAITRSSGRSIAISTGWRLGRAMARAIGATTRVRRAARGLAAANPPLRGMNWASMLELASAPCRGRGRWSCSRQPRRTRTSAPWLVDLLAALDRQLTHVEHNLSRYFSPNTHLSGEALALYVAGCALPELGASPGAPRSGGTSCPGSDPPNERRRRPRRTLRALPPLLDRLLPAGAAGRPALGRCSGGRFEQAAATGALPAHDLPTTAAAAADRRRRRRAAVADVRPRRRTTPATLGVAASCSTTPRSRSGRPPEESCWICGAAARSARRHAAPWPSAALPSSGYYVSRTAQAAIIWSSTPARTDS